MTRPGDPNAITSAPTTIHAVVDNDAHTVVLDLTAHVDILRMLAVALYRDDALAAEFALLGNPVNGKRQTLALHQLLTHPGVKDALTLTLAPTDADLLADRLLDAAQEPLTCDVLDDDGVACGYYADPTDPQARCNEHIAQDGDVPVVHVRTVA